MVKNFITPFVSFNDISITDVGEEDFAAITNIKTNRRNHYIIHFIVEGKGVFRSTTPAIETESELSKNMAFGIFPTHTVFYHSTPDNPLYYFWVGFSGTGAQSIMDYLGFNDKITTTQLENPDKIISSFHSLLTHWKKRQDKYLLLSDFFKLIYLLHQNSILQEANIISNSENEIFIKAENYILMHLQDNIKLNDLTAALNIDRSHFSKIFKKRYKITPHQYILKLRLKAAEKLLVETNYSIADIVEKLHFTDRYSFAKQFKKKYTHSPLDYRNHYTRQKRD